MSEGRPRAWFGRIFGRSVFSMLFGSFFEVKNNTAGLVATTLVFTLCFVVVSKIELITDLDKITDGVLNVIFVVVGYYFGSKQYKVSQDDED